MYIQKQNLESIESMIPWEREIYVTMLINHINEENEKLRQKELARGR